jgi:biotin operon repressor
MLDEIVEREHIAFVPGRGFYIDYCFVDFSPKSSGVLIALLQEGYVTKEELAERFSTTLNAIQVIVSGLRDSGVPILHRRGSFRLPSAYYIGDISGQKRDYEIGKDGFVLNTFTGYVRAPNGVELLPPPGELVVLQSIMEGLSTRDIVARLYDPDAQRPDARYVDATAVAVHVNRLNTGFGEKLIYSAGGRYHLRRSESVSAARQGRG